MTAACYHKHMFRTSHAVQGCHVSLCCMQFIGAQRGIPPGDNSGGGRRNGADKAARTSVAIVMVELMCVVGVGRRWGGLLMRTEG